MAQQHTGAPTTKVMSGTVGAAVATILVWVLKEAGAAVPDGTAVAITSVVTFLFGYYMPPAGGDAVEPATPTAVPST